jgi:uncharacterized membrane protein
MSANDINVGIARKARLAQRSTLALLLALILLIILDVLLHAPLTVGLIVAAVETLPLLLFVPAIRRGRAISAVWLALLLTLYFCWAVLGAYAPGLPGWLALLRALLIAACFSSALLMTRWQRVVEGW